ncbi:MAG: MoaD/ThiS family protein [Zavarzinella sp.]
MMNITVELFGPAERLVGQPELTIEVAGNPTVGDIVQETVRIYPQLGSLLISEGAVAKSVLLCVNNIQVDAKEFWPATPGTKLQIIPPVSGGC